MLHIITLSEIIRGSPTSYCFFKSRKPVVTKLYTVASGWAGSFVTTTETPRELSIDYYKVVAGVAPRAEKNASLMTMTNSELTSRLL
jgi:hypothetical protein